MPRRSLLSGEQRARLFDVPTTPAEMATHYVLSPEDLLLVRAKRRRMNRLGFAVQLCLLRQPGQGLGPGQQPPLAMLEFVAEQLGIPTTAFADYARRDQTRREHAAELHDILGLRSFRLSDWRDSLRVDADAAWATDRGEPIVQTMLTHLRARGVLVPDPTVLERIGLAARARARQRPFHALADGITEAERTALDGLLVTDPAVRRSRFAWLRDGPEAPAPMNMVALLDRLDWVRDVVVSGDRTARIHPARLARLVEEGDIMTAQHLANVEPLRQTALLVAGVADLETRLTDAILGMFCKYMGSLFTKAPGRDERRFQTTKRDVARTLLLFRRTIAALKRAKETGEEGVAAVEREVGFGKLDQALPMIDAVAGVADVEILATAAEKYAVVRRFSPRVLAAFRFQSSTPHDPLLAAIDLLKATDESGARVLPKRLPSAFLAPKWRRMIFAGLVPDRRLYETAVLAILRDRLRGAGVWVAGSRDHRAFENYLLPAEPAGTTSSGIAGEADPVRYVAARAGLLHERLQFVTACAARGELDGVEIEDGSLYIARTKPTVPDAARLMAGRLYGLLPRVRVTEVVADVADMTGFAACFTHLRTGNPPADLSALYAALLADGTNLGLSRMADATHGLSYHHLVNVAQWHVNEDNYASGRAVIVEAHHRHPMSAIWGGGANSSSDGQYFRAGGRAGPGGDVNAKYGIDPGVVLYTTQSGQYGPMHTRVISATASEAPYVLDGLHPQAHRTSLRITEHYTDTAGATDHVFGLCHLLGYRFAPRIKDLKDRKLYAVEKPDTCPVLKPLIGDAVDTAALVRGWAELLRVRASIDVGAVAPSTILRKLAAAGPNNALSQALRALGRIERTLFTLQWLSEPALRQRSHAGLNKGEASNALRRAVFFHRQGEFRDRTFENQSFRASGLSLLTAAIVHWNTIYLDQAVQQLRAQGVSIPDELLAHVAPLGWEHIALTGDYDWNTAKPANALRPLRAVPEAFSRRAA